VRGVLCSNGLLGDPVSNRFPLIKMTEHRFPPPWAVEETPTCFIVRDANGQALNYTYYFTEEMSLGGDADNAHQRGRAVDRVERG
jgi:hypothetical protein